MSYKNDQFAHMNGEVANVSSLNVTSRQFKHRDSVVRGIQYETVTKDGVTTSGWVPSTFILKKGYIRSLIEKVGAADGLGFVDLAKQRCDFQFNPSQLQQDVSMQLNMANIMLQSPAQLAVPLQGEVSFAFELMFDRTDTLNEEPANDPTDTGGPDQPNIGVMADVRALYEIIGQGVSQSRLAAQGNIATYLAQGEVIATGGAGLPASAGAQGPIGADGTTTGLGAENILGSSFFNPEINIGNSAFLMPLPVRIVFSSLFMVDGYVTNTSVVYTKFSRTLIPTQCIVQLSVTAKYIGFAKQQTFLTYQLSQAEQLTAEEIAQRISYGREVANNVSVGLNKFQVEPFMRVSYKVKKTVNAPGGSTSSVTFVDQQLDDKSIAQVLVPDNDYAAVVKDLKDFPSVLAGGSSYTQQDLAPNTNPTLAPKIRIKVGTEITDDQFTAMFGEASTSVTITATVSTYGPFNEADADYFVATEYDLSKTITSPTTPQITSPARLNTLKQKKVSEITGATTFTNVEDLKVLKTGKLLSASRTLLNNKYNYATMVRESNYFVIVSSINVSTVSNAQVGNYRQFTKGCIKRSKGSNWGVQGITATPDPIGVLSNELIQG